MNFRFSDLIESSTYETEGLCNGIPLRKQKETSQENSGALRAQGDWAKRMGPLNHYKGSLGPDFNFIQVTVPKCLPDRLEILVYANGFGCLYDGSNSFLSLLPVNTDKV